MPNTWTKAIIFTALIAMLTLQPLGQQTPAPTPAANNTATPSQTPVPAGVIRINVNLVQVDAVVTDSKGKPVTNLTAEDFELRQDGQPQKITSFEFVRVKDAEAKPISVVSVQPKNRGVPPPPPPTMLRPDQIHRTIALVVDDLGLSFDSITHIREALKQWVDKEMQPGDLVAVVRTSSGMGSLQQFTTNRQALHDAIDKVQYHLGRVGVSSFTPLVGAMPTDGVIDTSVFDDEVQGAYLNGSIGAIQYVVRGLRDFPGRKSLILFSESLRYTYLDGPGLVQSEAQISVTREEHMRKLTDEANRSSVVIYAVDPRGVINTGLSSDDNTSGLEDSQVSATASNRTTQLIESRDGMVDLTHRTGGLFVHDSNDMGSMLRQVVDDGDGYYLLGYQPESVTFDDDNGKTKFHTISVKVKRPGLTVRSRTGFLGRPDNKTLTQPEERKAQLANALLSPFATGDIRLHLTGLFYPSETEEPHIRVLVYFDPRDITLTEQEDGSRVGDIDLVAVTFDAEGQQVDTLAQTSHIKLPKEIYPDLLKSGFVYSMDLQVKKPGGYQLRMVLRDTATSRLGSATQFVEVPNVKNGRLTLSGIVIGAEKAPAAPPASGPVTDFPGRATPDGTPAYRVFKPGSSIDYVYQVLNAKADGEKKTQLETQIRLFRDGKAIYEGSSQQVNQPGQVSNPKRLAVSGRLQLAKLPPGNYILQIVVEDNLRYDKYKMTAQAIDFEVQ